MSQTKSLIARIHIAKKQLVMDEDTYRTVLINATNKSSCSKMSLAELEAVQAEMVRLGFQPTSNKTKGKPHNFYSQSMPLMMSKIEALLADQALPWAYADSIAKQMFGIERCSWVREPDQLKAIIAALYRRNKKARGNQS